MSYTKINSGDGWDESTDLSAANLAHMEEGIEEAHEYRARIATGTYSGDGSSERTISLPFTPSMVIVHIEGGSVSMGDGVVGWIAGGNIGIGSRPFLRHAGNSGASGGNEVDWDRASQWRIVSNGFQVHEEILNRSGQTYRYTALG